jgi:Na+/melibiose symporter-like transporter
MLISMAAVTDCVIWLLQSGQVGVILGIMKESFLLMGTLLTTDYNPDKTVQASTLSSVRESGLFYAAYTAFCKEGGGWGLRGPKYAIVTSGRDAQPLIFILITLHKV